jgi:hypothetical protein
MAYIYPGVVAFILVSAPKFVCYQHSVDLVFSNHIVCLSSLINLALFYFSSHARKFVISAILSKDRLFLGGFPPLDEFVIDQAFSLRRGGFLSAIVLGQPGTCKELLLM